MAHFAEINNLSKVINVLVVDDNDTLNLDGVAEESVGAKYLHDSLGGTWLQTSYNTHDGKHYNQEGVEDGGVALRKNFAGIGYTYDVNRDAFIPPQRYPSWVLNESICQYEAPVVLPDDGKLYEWDEATTNWIEITGET
jgi:hypothetical protein